MIAQYFIEFIVFSFLGWIWESIYCTLVHHGWSNRGFLFGPICPIYGSCVVLADVIFQSLARMPEHEITTLEIFLICAVGSAIVEFCTSWYLEKRFHAVWWDYSDLPLNIQGRICPFVSIGFGLAGIVVVNYLLPLIGQVQGYIPVLVAEAIALVFAAVLGADFALTEASLSSLLKDLKAYQEEFNARASETYESLVAASERLQERVDAAKELSEAHVARFSPNQRRIFGVIRTFRLKKNEPVFGEFNPVDILRKSYQERRLQDKLAKMERRGKSGTAQ